MSAEWYIVDTRTIVGNCAMFWGPRRSGYVCDIREAGRYSEEEARSQQRSRPTDVAVPCDVIDAMVKHHVRADTPDWYAAIKDARERDPAPPAPKPARTQTVNCGGCGRFFAPVLPYEDRCWYCRPLTRSQPIRQRVR